MDRPMFETQADLDNEKEVISDFCIARECTYQKLPVRLYKVDWLLSETKPKAFAEVKCRRRFYDPFRIALHKFETLVRLANASHLRGLIIVRWDDKEGIYWVNVTSGAHDGIVWMADSRNREEADAEPCVELSFSRFRLLKSKKISEKKC